MVRGYGLIDTFEGSSREYSGPRCHLITGTWVIATHPSDTECTFALVENFQADDPSVMGYSSQLCFRSRKLQSFSPAKDGAEHDGVTRHCKETVIVRSHHERTRCCWASLGLYDASHQLLHTSYCLLLSTRSCSTSITDIACLLRDLSMVRGIINLFNISPEHYPRTHVLTSVHTMGGCCSSHAQHSWYLSRRGIIQLKLASMKLVVPQGTLQ